MSSKTSEIKSGAWQPTHNLSVLGLGVVGFLVILAGSWLIELEYKKLPYLFESILKIYGASPALIFLSILLLCLIVFFILRQERNVILLRKIQEEMRLKDEAMQEYADFAKKIGKKDFSADVSEISEEDELGSALLIMRTDLIEADKKEAERAWIAKGKEEISSILRLHNNLDTIAYETLVAMINYTNAIQGAFYLYNETSRMLVNTAHYAYNRKKYVKQEFSIGEGLIGQCAYEMDYIYRKEIPDDYVTITSGILGDKKPQTILIVPLISDEKLQGIIELASLQEDIPELTIVFVKELAEIIAQTVFNLKVNARTEKLLKEARIMTEELKENEEELRQNAEEMRATQEELQKTNKSLETQIKEVENAQKRLHSLLENASEVISIYDANGIVKYESPSVKHILGYSPEEVIGKSAFDTVHQGDDSPMRKAFVQLLKEADSPITFEFQYKRGDEEILWLESTGRNFLDNPAIEGIIFNTRDITVRKIAERAQRMSGQMQALSENSPDLIMRINLEGEFYYANPAVEAYTGIRKEDIIKHNVEDVALDFDFSNLIRTTIPLIIEKEQKIEREFTFETRQGRKAMQFNAIPEYSEEKELETILMVAHDITEQKKTEQIIKDKNKQITDSINYAQRIQKAILPNNRVIQQYLPKSFILYKPRDVVSGDFPWFFKKGDNIYLAVVDCTGHGVPGAMLSFIGYFLLNNIVDHDVEITAGQVLDSLHEQVRATLKQDQEGANARDGMDIAFCKINKKKKELHYAGAHRPLYLLREGELSQYKGDPKPIGGIPISKKQEKSFDNHVINYISGDKFFFFSDGLADQVGGPDGRKYQVSRIREQILTYQGSSMGQYSKHFARDFIRWKGEHKQIDDILLIGIEF